MDVKEREEKDMNATVSVIMGSTSDWETMKNTCDILDEFEIPYKKRWCLHIGHLI